MRTTDQGWYSAVDSIARYCWESPDGNRLSIYLSPYFTTLSIHNNRACFIWSPLLACFKPFQCLISNYFFNCFRETNNRGLGRASLLFPFISTQITKTYTIHKRHGRRCISPAVPITSLHHRLQLLTLIYIHSFIFISIIAISIVVFVVLLYFLNCMFRWSLK